MKTRLFQTRTAARLLAIATLGLSFATASAQNAPNQPNAAPPGVLPGVVLTAADLPQVQPKARDPLAVLGALRDFTLQTLTLPNDAPPEQFNVALRLGDRPVTMGLGRFSIFTQDFKAYVELGHGVYAEYDMGPVRTYRGVIVEIPGSMVSATLLPDGRLSARIDTRDGQVWHVEDLEQMAPGTHVVYREADAKPLPPGWCGVHDEPHTAPQPPAPSPGRGGEVFWAILSCESDVEWYQAWGAAGWSYQMVNIINDVVAIYTAETSICIQISTLYGHTAEEDPYPSTNANLILDEFQNLFNTSLPYTQQFRHLAQLFSGKNFDLFPDGSDVVGLARPGGIGGCLNNGWTTRTLAYSIVQDIPVHSRRVNVSAHEMGHNWGCEHCDGQGTCGIMSAVIPADSGYTHFGEYSAAEIRARRDVLAPCGRACGFNGADTVCPGYCSLWTIAQMAASADQGTSVPIYPNGLVIPNVATGHYNERLTIARPMTLTAPAGPIVIGRP